MAVAPGIVTGADHSCPYRLKLKALHRFQSTATAVEDITAVQEGRLTDGLSKFLVDEVTGGSVADGEKKKKKKKLEEMLIVSDPKLGALLCWIRARPG